ncbi:MAG: hypothetical protein EU548_00310 [Promethearchaeota archaeon]|nr:MAG: hypothetical protein EU548_00310 [Candidatus Lokiarchaeota archaeon]
MCNDCECEFSYLCSIKGYLPFGACCKKCSGYDDDHSCVNYKVKLPAIQIMSPQEFQVKTKELIKLYP